MAHHVGDVQYTKKFSHTSLLQQKEKSTVKHTFCTCAQCMHRFIQAWRGWLWRMYGKQTLWRIIPFQFSVGNVKIIIRWDSSVGRQHLFTMEQGWGGTVTTSRCGSGHRTGFHMKLFKSSSLLSLVLLLFLALLIHDLFIHHIMPDSNATLISGLLHLLQLDCGLFTMQTAVETQVSPKKCYLHIKSLHMQDSMNIIIKKICYSINKYMKFI